MTIAIDESHVRRALLHARALQFTSDLGDCGFSVVLDGDSVRAYVQRLLDARLDSDSATEIYSPGCSVVSRTSIKRLHDGQFKRIVASEVLMGAPQ